MGIFWGLIMISIRANQRREVLHVHPKCARKLPARGRALAVPLMVLALAGCGGASGTSAPNPTPSAVTSSAPAEPLIQQASHSCRLDSSDYATLGDAGYTITLEGEPENHTNVADYYKVTGLTASQIACVLTALSVPDSVVSQMDATRAMDGMQKASWDKISATWTYHPDDGFRMILTESK